MGVGAEKRRENCVEVVAEVRSDGDEGSLRCGEGRGWLGAGGMFVRRYLNL